MKKQVISKIIITILALAFLTFAVFVYTEFYGTPWEYLKAKSAISDYILETYGDHLKIEGMYFNWKDNHFVAQVVETDNPRVRASISFVKGGIIDYYSSGRKINIYDEINNTIVSLISATTAMGDRICYSSASIQIDETNIPDRYSGKEPIWFDLALKDYYSETLDFVSDAHTIISTVFSSKLPIEQIRIEGFKPDGNTRLLLTVIKGEEREDLEYFLEKVEVVANR